MVRKLSLYNDAPELTAAELAEMHLVDAALEGYNFRPAKLAARPWIGRPPAEVRKVPVTIRLDADIVATFKATGAGWQSRMNAALREAAEKIALAEPA